MSMNNQNNEILQSKRGSNFLVNINRTPIRFTMQTPALHIFILKVTKIFSITS